MEEIEVKVVNYSDRDNLVLLYKDPETRKRKAVSAGTSNRKQAEKAARRLQSELENGKFKSRLRVTWDEFRERYEAEYIPTLRPRSAEKALQVLDDVSTVISLNQLSQLTTRQVAAYKRALQDRKNSVPTIIGKLSYLRAALRWANAEGMLAEVPKFDMPKRPRGETSMKGRPIKQEEMERMQKVAKKVVGEDRSKLWEELLTGLWWSGLRLGEILQLTWDDSTRLKVKFTGRHPKIYIPAELDKGGKERLLPIAPQFAEMLLAVPENQRKGYVFPLRAGMTSEDEQYTVGFVGRKIAKMGEKANVVVSRKGKTVKYASAHDFRRSFGTRWAAKHMPAAGLKAMMRHESIETTLRYYVEHEADDVADMMYTALSNANSGESVNKSVNKPESGQKKDNPHPSELVDG